MISLWNEPEAASFAADAQLGLRVYTSRLLGREPDLVLHGGGNTSVKDKVPNVFGEMEEVLLGSGSGWDLETIGAGGLASVPLSPPQRLASLAALSDTDRMRELRAAMLDPAA